MKKSLSFLVILLFICGCGSHQGSVFTEEELSQMKQRQGDAQKAVAQEMPDETSKQDVCGLQADDFLKKKCFIKKAIDEQDISYCMTAGCRKTLFRNSTFLQNFCKPKESPTDCFDRMQQFKKENKDPYLGLEYCVDEEIKACMLEISLASKNPAICDEISDKKYYLQANECNYILGIRNLNQRMCEKIIMDTSKRDNCSYIVAKNHGTKSPCDGIGKEKLKNTCIANIAYVAGDKSICETLPDVYRQRCEKSLGQQYPAETAEKYSNYRTCKGMYKQEEQRVCFYNTALVTQDPSVCDYITDEATRRDCLWYVNTPPTELLK